MNDRSKTKTIQFHAKSAKYSEFDNSAPYAIRLHDLTWPTVTHYLLAEQYPGESINRIRQAVSVEEAIRLAPGKYATERNKWSVVRDDYLISALRAKFSQHLDLEQMLHETGEASLVYANKADSYLGVGPKGYGPNMLGRLLMAVRRRMSKPVFCSKLSKQELQDLAEQEEIARKNPDNAGKLSDLAFKYLQHRWYTRALSTARFSLTADPDHEWGHYVMAICFMNTRRYKSAIEPLKKLIRIDPEDSEYFRMLSNVHRQLDNEIPAILYNRRADLLDADDE